MKKLLIIISLATAGISNAQETYPVNGSLDKRPGLFAFTHATIVVNADQTITDGVLLVKGRIIEAVGPGLSIPKGYVVVDLRGKYIYPSLVDAYSTYGVPESQPVRGTGNGILSNKKGAYSWNEAIRPESTARSVFAVDTKKNEELKKAGFGTVNSIIADGIARGTSTAVTLLQGKENELILKDEAAATYSFSKGSSATSYPESLMGVIALLRQTYYDGRWYSTQKEEYNISLGEFNRQQNLPQLFEVESLQDLLRADKVGDEFGKQYIFKSGGDEYQRIDLVKASGGSLIVPLNFPKAFDIESTADVTALSLAQMKHWELAPANAGAVEKAGIKFAITSHTLDGATFWANLRLAIDNGLSEKQAFKSLTEIPAQLLGVDDKVGSLVKGKLANFLITSGSLFKKENVIYENWVQGSQFVVSSMAAADLSGVYNLSIDGLSALTLKVTASGEGKVERVGADSVKSKANLQRQDDQVTLHFSLKKNPAGEIQLSGYLISTSPISFKGDALLPDGTKGKWTATYKEAFRDTPGADIKTTTPLSKITYPFGGYGQEQPLKAEAILFKNATVWTNEKEGKLLNTDVLIENGKIKAIGKDLAGGSAKVIDATGKHISPGVIDEHSHIALFGAGNEATQTVTSEVRIQDVLNPNDINIYRQLAGGVTTSHILHGSANSIGGQTQIIKLRWGTSPEGLKFEGSDGFIKFALGENVKQSNWGSAGADTIPSNTNGHRTGIYRRFYTCEGI
ncbi:MAG: amidohydrolase family protein [Bacteroidota bacterium]